MSSRITKWFILLIISQSVFLFSGCKGPAGKKVATEALELIEKEGTTKAGSAIEKGVVQTNRSVTETAEEYSTRRNSNYRPRPHGHGGASHQAQTYTILCSQCGGTGAVYAVDYYGNMQCDYYGNPILNLCPTCNGTGTVLVTQ